VDVNELIDDVLECRMERIVGRHERKFGLSECVFVADEDEYWDIVRWRPSGYVREEDEREEDEEVDKAGESKRREREFFVFN
jgi:hypothetical protein